MGHNEKTLPSRVPESQASPFGVRKIRGIKRER
jgi:hypothetical protein